MMITESPYPFQFSPFTIESHKPTQDPSELVFSHIPIRILSANVFLSVTVPMTYSSRQQFNTSIFKIMMHYMITQYRLKSTPNFDLSMMLLAILDSYKRNLLFKGRTVPKIIISSSFFYSV